MVERLFVKVGKVYHNIKLIDLKYIHTEGNYSILHTPSQNFVIKTSLSKLEKSLPENIFTRIHRNFVVNENAITKVDARMNKVFIANEDLPIGKNYKEQLFEKMIILS